MINKSEHLLMLERVGIVALYCTGDDAGFTYLNPNYRAGKIAIQSNAYSQRYVDGVFYRHIPRKFIVKCIGYGEPHYVWGFVAEGLAMTSCRDEAQIFTVGEVSETIKDMLNRSRKYYRAIPV